MIVWANLTKEQRLEFVAPLWTEGKSANEISRLMVGASRNAIIGVVYRAGLRRLTPGASKTTGYRALRPEPKPKREPKPKLSGAQRRKLTAPARLELRAQAKVFGETKVEPAIARQPRASTKADAFAPLPGSTPVPWTERGFGCAWPVDVPGAEEQHSCGLETGGATYCAAHLAMRTQPPAPGKPKRSPSELTRALRRYAA